MSLCCAVSSEALWAGTMGIGPKKGPRPHAGAALPLSKKQAYLVNGCLLLLGQS